MHRTLSPHSRPHARPAGRDTHSTAPHVLPLLWLRGPRVRARRGAGMRGDGGRGAGAGGRRQRRLPRSPACVAASAPVALPGRVAGTGFGVGGARTWPDDTAPSHPPPLQLGRFARIASPGFSCLAWPLEYFAGDAPTSLRVQQLDVRVESKTADDVFVTVQVSVQYVVDPDKVYELWEGLGRKKGEKSPPIPSFSLPPLGTTPSTRRPTRTPRSRPGSWTRCGRRARR